MSLAFGCKGLRGWKRWVLKSYLQRDDSRNYAVGAIGAVKFLFLFFAVGLVALIPAIQALLLAVAGSFDRLY